MIEQQRRRVIRRDRTAHRGQSLVIFALIAAVLFAVVGMAVDGGFAYLVSDKLERGAIAAALAGVPDMPTLVPPAPNDATTAAKQAAKLNGWTPGGANNVAITVATVTNPDTGQPYNNRLQVTITSDVPVFFMKLLGFGTHREARTAVAEYLPPITFGQPGGQLGSDLTNLGTGNNYYFMRSEGWGTDRGQGDPYGPNPLDWGGGNSSAAPNSDTHQLNVQTEPSSQPLALPARGGASYQIYVPAGQTTTLNVYNPVFAPDHGAANALGYTYHEDDGDFVETGAGCLVPSGSNAGCAGPTDARAWPVMSYTVYKSVNPFDHTRDQWLSNLTIKSIDASAGTNYIVPGVTATPQPLGGLGAMYHQWMDVTRVPTGAAYSQLAAPLYSGGVPTLSGGATGTTYRLRVDQLDQGLADPATDANASTRTLQSQAHKGYAVQASGCATCTVAALNDITLFTPINGGGTFTMPLVSIPPDYQGRNFSLYVYDPGDVTCNGSGCSNVITLLQPISNGGGYQPALTTDGVFASTTSSQFPSDATNYTNKVAGPGNAAIQTQSGSPGIKPTNLYNGKWLRFDIAVPTDYATNDVGASPATWYWKLQYSTSQPAGDTVSANLGFSGAPVHIVSG